MSSRGRPDDRLDTCAGVPLVRSSAAGGALLVSKEARQLRSELRPLAWMVLEEVAFEAVSENGRLVARVSARRIAGRLGLDPGTVAGALRLLRGRELLALEREVGAGGRFGLSIYVLGKVSGLSVLTGATAPCLATPHVVDPPPREPGVAIPLVDERRRNTGDVTRSAGSEQGSGQAALDLGLGSA
jgi:hypothetical protein